MPTAAGRRRDGARRPTRHGSSAISRTALPPPRDALHAVVQADRRRLRGAVVARQFANVVGREAALGGGALGRPGERPLAQRVEAHRRGARCSRRRASRCVISSCISASASAPSVPGSSARWLVALLGRFAAPRVDAPQPGAVALGLLREGPEVQVRGDRVAAPDDDQLALGVVLEVHADLAAVGGGQRLAAGARADGAVEQRRAELVGTSARPCSRPAPGPSCRRSCRARWPAGRARRWRAAAPRRCRALRPSRCARSGRCPSGRRASAGAARARGCACARRSATPCCTARRASADGRGRPARAPRGRPATVTRSAQVSGQSCGQAPRTTRWLEALHGGTIAQRSRPAVGASASVSDAGCRIASNIGDVFHALPERRRWRSGDVRVRIYARHSPRSRMP